MNRELFHDSIRLPVLPECPVPSAWRRVGSVVGSVCGAVTGAAVRDGGDAPGRKQGDLRVGGSYDADDHRWVLAEFALIHLVKCGAASDDVPVTCS